MDNRNIESEPEVLVVKSRCRGRGEFFLKMTNQQRPFFGLIMISFVLSCMVSVRMDGADAALKEIEKGLPDGLYLIERKLAPTPMVASSTNASIQESRQDNPVSTFFRMYLVGDAFIVHGLSERPTEDEISPVGTIFASVSEAGSWIMEEHANRVRTLDMRFEEEVHQGPMVAGFVYHQRLVDGLRRLGLSRIRWDTVRFESERRISGYSLRGRPFVGSVERDGEGRIRRLVYAEEDDQFEYSVHIDRDPGTEALSRVSIERRELDADDWGFFSEFSVLSFEELNDKVDMTSYWERYRDDDTVAFRYDPTSDTTTYEDDEGNAQVVVRSEDLSWMNNRNKAMLFLIILGAISIPVLVVFLGAKK